MPREWSTDTRDPWNAKIHGVIKLIDLHTSLYLQSGDQFHDEQAKVLRSYVNDLKTWIHQQEQLNKKNNG